MKRFRNTLTRRCRLFWLTVFFLCSNSSISAQYPEDSVTVTEGVREPPAEDNSDVYTESENQPEAEFLPLDPSDSLSLQFRVVPDSSISRLQADEDFWYANAEFEKRKKKEDLLADPYIPVTQRRWFKSLLWVIIIVVFAAVILFYLANSNLGLFRRNKKIATAAGLPGDEMPEDIFAINYQQEIDKAAARGDFRMAVRLQFLRLLKLMTERNIIRYQQDRTNLDYLVQLRDTGYYSDFFRITRHFEYSWYGHFEVTAEAYGLIRKDIEQFENSNGRN
ncbi:MAG: DUF4129 domain-containing protein [Sphingobacteriales bacterium]|nr:DUF4129 domain-containing protein [Sphingobacteriales bacterium]